MLYVFLYVLIVVLIVLFADVKVSDFVVVSGEKHIKKKSLAQVKRSQFVNVKKSFISKQIDGMRVVLSESALSMTFERFMQVTILSSVIGFILGLLVKNPFLSIILAVGFLYLPLQCVKYLEYQRKKKIFDNLPFVTSLVTNSFMDSESIKLAVGENYVRMIEPYKSVFSEFYYSTAVINPNVKESLVRMRSKIDNHDWYDWCNVLIDCVDDKDNKHMLPAIVEKMSDERLMQKKADVVMESAIQQYVVICFLSIALIPMMGFMLSDVFYYLVNTVVGKLCVAFLFVLIFVTAVYVINLNKPIGRNKK